MQERFQIGEYWLSQVKPASIWHITWYDKAARQTRRKSLGISDFEAAKTKLAQWVLTLALQLHFVLSSDSMDTHDS
ncbi:hypothetical protein, partial [Acetobacter orientalis]|uniref:hypothetical protein n=2 Tax=Acetobacter orientalis TaxID=146474 RepID=UPI00248E0E3E